MSGVMFKKFRVMAKTRESKFITSFSLAPENGGMIDEFKSGQYITLRLPDQTIRTYTISSSTKNRLDYRISVKREAAPDESLPPGKASNYLHDIIETGELIDVLSPKGDFYLDEHSPRPVLLISGGVGITPMISMLHALESSSRPVYFIHACKNSEEHAFINEVNEIQDKNNNIRTVFFYRNEPTLSGKIAQHRQDSIDREFLEELGIPSESDCYLCGPNKFMESIYDALTSHGISKNTIYYEFFGGGTTLGEPTGLRLEPSENSDTQIELAKTGKTLDWSSFSGSLLEFMNLNDVTTSSSCRLGVCGTCECRVLSGDVTYFTEPLDPPSEGHVLLCVSRPLKGKLVLDL